MIRYRSKAYERYRGQEAPDYARLANSYKRRIGKRVKISRNWRCLDIACGFGNFIAYLRSLGVKDFVGVDSSREAIAVAGKEFGASRLVCSEVFKFLAETSDRYPFISVLDFIEHLGKDEVFELLELLNPLQRPGDRLLIRTPNANGLFGMAARYNDITHEICFTPLSISDVLKHGGYRVIDIWEDGAAAGSLIQTIHWILWSVVKIMIRCINAVETGRWGDDVLARNMWVLAERHETAA